MGDDGFYCNVGGGRSSSNMMEDHTAKGRIGLTRVANCHVGAGRIMMEVRNMQESF